MPEKLKKNTYESDKGSFLTPVQSLFIIISIITYFYFVGDMGSKQRGLAFLENNHRLTTELSDHIRILDDFMNQVSEGSNNTEEGVTAYQRIIDDSLQDVYNLSLSYSFDEQIMHQLTLLNQYLNNLKDLINQPNNNFNSDEIVQINKLFTDLRNTLNKIPFVSDEAIARANQKYIEQNYSDRYTVIGLSLIAANIVLWLIVIIKKRANITEDGNDKLKIEDIIEFMPPMYYEDEEITDESSLPSLEDLLNQNQQEN